MSSLPRPLLARARVQQGLVTVGELDACGVVGRSRSRAVHAGLLVPVHRGVYRIASHEITFEQRCLAAFLAAPDAVISGPSAGRLYGLRKTGTNDVHVLAGRTINLPGVVSHRTNLLGSNDVVDHGRLRILRPARLVCDLAIFLSDDDLESVIEQVLRRRMTSLSVLRSVARSFMACGRNGTSRLARVLDSRPDWIRPPDSDLEVRVLRALRGSGLDVRPQVPVLLDDGSIVHIDVADPSTRFGVEIDHIEWHGGRLDVQYDKIRDRALMRLGWIVPRVTDDDLRHRFAQTIDQVVEIARVAGAKVAAV